MNIDFRKSLDGADWLQIALALGAVGVGVVAALLLLAVEPLLIFGGIVALAGVYVVFRYPEWGMVGLVVIVYANLSDVLQSTYGAPSLAQPYIALLCVVIAARWAVFGETPKGWKLPALLLCLYGFVTFLSLFQAKDFDVAQEGLSDFIKVGVITLLITMLLRRADTFRRVVWALILVGLFLGTISVFQATTGTFSNTYGGFARPPIVDVSDGESTARIAGPIGDPNFYAQVMLVVLPLALDRFWKSRSQLARLVAGAAVGIVGMTVILTFSRGAFLAMALVLGLMFIGRKLNPVAVLLTPLVVIALIQFAPANYTDRLSTLTDFLPGQAEAGTTDESFRGRTSEMLAALMMFRDHPLVGVGVGNYNVRYLEYSREIGLDGRLANRSAHSLYLEIAAERGLFGLAAFAVLMGVTIRQLFRSSQLLSKNGHEEMGGLIKALGVALVGYMVTSIFLHDAFPRYFWLLIGISLSTIYVARDEMLQQKDQPSPDTAALHQPSVEALTR